MSYDNVDPSVVDLESMMEEESTKEADANEELGGETLENLVRLGSEMEMLKEQIENLDAEKKVLTERYDKLRKSIIPDLMTNAGVARDGKGSFTIASGARISMRNDLYAGVRADDKPRLFDYLRANGLGDLIREDVHHQTLKAVVREWLGDGKPIPEFINQYYETSVTLTRGRRS